MHDTTTSQLDRISLMLTEFSRGNFNVEEGITEGKGPLNIIITGVKTLGKTLENYRNQIDYQHTILDNILSNIDEVIYVRDINPDDTAASTYSFISARSMEIIGLDAQELNEDPRRWIEAVHPEDTAITIELFQKVLRGQEIVMTYRMYHHGKKQYRWIEDRISAKVNPHGQVLHIYGSARDVTDQQETNLALEKTNMLVTRLITSSDQVFYIVSLDKVDPFKNTFTYLSSHVEGIIGYSVEDVRNDPLTWIKAIHPDDLEQVKATTKDMFISKNPRTRVYRMRHKYSGEYVWLEDYVVPILDDNGWIREFYASARDITARRMAEIEREKLIDELSRRHDELMQFSHIVSHNLRAPVASILGLARILEDEVHSEEAADTRRYILQAARSMDDLLRDLNTVLSVRSTQDEKKEAFLLSNLISSVCINLKKEIGESGTTLNVMIDHNADELTSIKSYIQSTLFNLINNAIKYRSPDRHPLINVKGCKKGNQTVISIEDNGLGIDLDAHRERIFVLYGRLHNDREGKGLGLYMTKMQIESLNGTIEVESEKGRGTIFTITL